VTVSELAALGPALVTDSVYVMFAPGPTGSALSDFVIDRSAEAATAVLSVSELLPETGSVVVAAIVAVFESDPLAAVTVVLIVIAGAVPTPSVARVQVTVPDA
jgi:hypothetical protein